MFLSLALNYGSRAEIVDGIQSIAHRVADGTLSPDAIDERTVDDALYTAGIPDPDVVIRTSGELRLSNYLLWQALRTFARRERRFGAAENQTP